MFLRLAHWFGRVLRKGYANFPNFWDQAGRYWLKLESKISKVPIYLFWKQCRLLKNYSSNCITLMPHPSIGSIFLARPNLFFCLKNAFYNFQSFWFGSKLLGKFRRTGHKFQLLKSTCKQRKMSVLFQYWTINYIELKLLNIFFFGKSFDQTSKSFWKCYIKKVKLGLDIVFKGSS